MRVRQERCISGTENAIHGTEKPYFGTRGKKIAERFTTTGYH